MRHVGQVWEYIEDGGLYLVVPDPIAEEADRSKLLNLETGETPTVSVFAFSSPHATKRWRRLA